MLVVPVPFRLHDDGTRQAQAVFAFNPFPQRE
jgi:hypothetical protein